MAFAAPQFGGLMQVPTADHDMDMLSDAPEEGHDFDIDVDAMSDAEDRDVDFVLDGGNAPAPGAGPETVDQEMLEAAADLKTVDAPMGEPDHVSDEAMDSVVALAGQKGDIPVPHERFSNQNTTAIGDAHDSQLAPQQYSGDEISYQSHSVLDATPTVPMASFVTDAKTSDDHTLPTPTDAGVLSFDPNSASRDPQDEEREAEHLPTQTTVGTISNGPSIPSPDQDRALVAGKDKDLNQTDKNPGNNGPGQSGRLQDGTATDSQYREEDEQAEDQVEGDTLKKSSSSECATLVSYDGSQLSLFPPADGLPEAYMLEDASLADRALRELFVACRQALGASIGDDSQLQIEIPGLHLTIEEDSMECSVVTLFQIVDIHHHLNRNDGIEHLVPLPVTLRTRPRISARLRELAEAVSAAKGYSSFLPEDDDEYDPAENEVEAEEQSEDHDSTDEYGVDSGYENPSALEHDEYQETDGAVNESATERDTNSERKSGSDEQDSDQNSTPADNTAEDDRDDYSEDEDELRNVAGDSIEPKRDAAAHDLDEESVADESPEEFNVLDPFAGDHGDEGQTLVNDEYAEPKFGEGTSTAEGSGVYLGAHEATLNEEEEYAQLDDWLAPEDETFGVTNDADADAVSGEPLGDDEDYGNVNVAYGEEWGNEVEARTSPAKPSSDSPLGKRARERSVDDAEPESDQEAKRVKAT